MRIFYGGMLLMHSILERKELWDEIEKLSSEEQLELAERLLKLLRKGKASKESQISWEKLYGLGKGLWGEDAQEYVNQLREDR